jgi:hypothetical protein
MQLSKAGKICFNCSVSDGLIQVGAYHYCQSHFDEYKIRYAIANAIAKDERRDKLRKILSNLNEITEQEFTPSDINIQLRELILPIIQPFIDSGTFIAIGISALHNVKYRTNQYYPLKDGWNKGFVELGRYYNPLNLTAFEDAAIQHYKDSEFLTNDNGGGGGWIKPEHKVWVLYLKTATKKPSVHWYAKNNNK